MISVGSSGIIFFILSQVSPSPVPAGPFFSSKIVFFFFEPGISESGPRRFFLFLQNNIFYIFLVSPGLEGDDDGDDDDDGDGRISSHVQARYSITPRD